MTNYGRIITNILQLLEIKILMKLVTIIFLPPIAIFNINIQIKCVYRADCFLSNPVLVINNNKIFKNYILDTK